MKCPVLVLLSLAALVAARPDSILDLNLDDIQHYQVSEDDTTVTGTYRWTSPEGVDYFVKYVADASGFRVLDSNAVPTTAKGVRADGSQGSFFSSEEFDSRE
ncbi:cuticular protein 47Eg-like [Panulirus ornatus]|uniref:cuticular protein 47Eg-like n=1 Tax=Panulirus ornatus TaxID=150431 RepID=UPI003A8AAB32